MSKIMALFSSLLCLLLSFVDGYSIDWNTLSFNLESLPAVIYPESMNTVSFCASAKSPGWISRLYLNKENLVNHNLFITLKYQIENFKEFGLPFAHVSASTKIPSADQETKKSSLMYPSISNAWTPRPKPRVSFVKPKGGNLGKVCFNLRADNQVKDQDITHFSFHISVPSLSLSIASPSIPSIKEQTIARERRKLESQLKEFIGSASVGASTLEIPSHKHLKDDELESMVRIDDTASSDSLAYPYITFRLRYEVKDSSYEQAQLQISDGNHENVPSVAKCVLKLHTKSISRLSSRGCDGFIFSAPRYLRWKDEKLLVEYDFRFTWPKLARNYNEISVLFTCQKTTFETKILLKTFERQENPLKIEVDSLLISRALPATLIDFGLPEDTRVVEIFIPSEFTKMESCRQNEPRLMNVAVLRNKQPVASWALPFYTVSGGMMAYLPGQCLNIVNDYESDYLLTISGICSSSGTLYSPLLKRSNYAPLIGEVTIDDSNAAKYVDDSVRFFKASDNQLVINLYSPILAANHCRSRLHSVKNIAIPVHITFEYTVINLNLNGDCDKKLFQAKIGGVNALQNGFNLKITDLESSLSWVTPRLYNVFKIKNPFKVCPVQNIGILPAYVEYYSPPLAIKRVFVDAKLGDRPPEIGTKSELDGAMMLIEPKLSGHLQVINPLADSIYSFENSRFDKKAKLDQTTMLIVETRLPESNLYIPHQDLNVLVKYSTVDRPISLKTKISDFDTITRTFSFQLDVYRLQDEEFELFFSTKVVLFGGSIEKSVNWKVPRSRILRLHT